MSRLIKELKFFARQSGGSHKTCHDRIRIAGRLGALLLSLNIQVKSLSHLKTKHVEHYVDARLSQGVAKRTVQNEMSALRNIFRMAGRERLETSPRLSNQALGLSGASRAGTKQAIPDATFQVVYQKALERNAGFAATLKLARLMGLRSQEAVQCSASLKSWRKQLEQPEPKLHVVFGTKGGRPRQTSVLDVVAVKAAVEQAIAVAEQRGGKLIDKPDLRQAMNYWRTHTTRIGLKGCYSPHSLRYAWAQDALAFYQQNGFSPQEARALVSMDLGHGDGRGRYVERVYSRST
ncbi:integrase domain-containing protein [Xenorhabdus bovienii]|uniref:Putative DNA-binding prophage protein n=1 Tax=Xenorhabdus bovienii str. Intermedium TaxID=1379677 RepID=A0A077QPH9_XENBV|nr:integrase domain-containing protein [Xenorhabdus bovienii]CDH34211.1 Putative DNA-binding prophage protein [Xenorhabdus bovienii str. Intermedium]